MSINRVTICGNLGRDPELRATQSGTQVLTFSVCVNERRKNQQTGDWYDVPNWVRCTMFGNRAESVSRYVGKGSHVTVAGRLRENKWQDKQGNNRSMLEVVVDDIDFTGSQRDQQPQQAAYYDDDCPF